MAKPDSLPLLIPQRRRIDRQIEQCDVVRQCVDQDGRHVDTDALVGELAEIFEVAAESIRPDVEAALADFAAQDLLVDGAAPA